jgi:hypothetical protein
VPDASLPIALLFSAFTAILKLHHYFILVVTMTCTDRTSKHIAATKRRWLTCLRMTLTFSVVLSKTAPANRLQQSKEGG